MKYVSMVPVDDLWAIYRTDNEDGSESYAKTRVLFAAIREDGEITLLDGCVDGFFSDVAENSNLAGVIGPGCEFTRIDPTSAESAELENMFGSLKKATAR